MGIIDTHAHITCDELYPQIDDILQRAADAKVERILCICLNRKELKRAFLLKERYAWIDIAFGYHPSDLYDLKDTDWQYLEDVIHDERIIAVGEIGLDYHWDDVDKETQKQAFIRQMELANACGKPILVHMRDATMDTMKLLRQYKKGKGMLHCYSGSLETAREAIGMDMYLAVGGPLTFKNARGLPEVTAQLPIERVMIETDCPYLTPHPHRGKQNEPMYLVHTFEKLAEIRQMNADELMDRLKENYHSLFTMKE